MRSTKRQEAGNLPGAGGKGSGGGERPAERAGSTGCRGQSPHSGAHGARPRGGGGPRGVCGEGGRAPAAAHTANPVEPPVGMTGGRTQPTRRRGRWPRGPALRGALHPERPSASHGTLPIPCPSGRFPWCECCGRPRVDVRSPVLSEASRTCSPTVHAACPGPTPAYHKFPPNSLETGHPSPAPGRPPGLRTTPHQLLRRPHAFSFPGVELGSRFLRFGSQVHDHIHLTLHGLTSLNQGLL